jgi:manganese transport protein
VPAEPPNTDRPPERAAGSVRKGSDSSITVEQAHQVLTGRRRGWRSVLPFFGPAFVASVAYVDPGNFATNIQGGSAFGYRLLWVIIASNLMAMLIQTLSAKLGIATGRNLAETIRDQFPRPVVWAMWVLMELVAMATDLAEFLGAALGFYLLLGIPLLPAALITGVVTFLILALERRGFRPLEIVIISFVGVIAVCYLVEVVRGRPDWAAMASSLVPPRLGERESVLLAVGILGATIMPHVIFLHSALTGGRIIAQDPEQARRIFRFEVLDVTVAMGIAGLVNAAMLVTAAATFYRHGLFEIASLEEAHRTLSPLLGPASSTIFAVALLASGLSSSTVGTLSGQVIMQGFLRRRIPLWLRRLVTMLPAIVVIGLGFDPTRTLVLSQVVLSFGLPFALVPLVLFTARRDLMGSLVNHRVTTVVAALVTLLISALNVYLLILLTRGG